jgi:hypothetical protein
MLRIEIVQLGSRGWSFTVNGKFVGEEFDPQWGLTLYSTEQAAREAAEAYIKSQQRETV